MRTHRRRWGLTQKDLARLLGVSSSQVSKWERLERKPKLSIVFAYQALFEALPHELLPDLYGLSRTKVCLEARRLHEEIDGVDTRSTRRKRKLLTRILETARDD